MRYRILQLVSLLLLGSTAVQAKKEKPEIGETPFRSLPTNLFYFEDSNVVIAQDTLPGIIYRSEDAGANWKKVTEIKESESFEVLPHPYNNQVAVAVGTAKTHWITKDQGKTWKSFDATASPVLGKSPINFHATDPDKIIFMMADCEGFTCEGKVWKSINGVDGFPTDRLRHFTPLTVSIRSSFFVKRQCNAYGQRVQIYSRR